MGELRAEARDQSLPKELREDLAGISASIDALGAQDGGAEALRSELNSMRGMVDQLAREDSVRSLETRWQSMEEQVTGLDMTALREELVNLAYRVDEIREFLSTMPASGQGQAIEDKIVELSHTIEAMTHQTATASTDFPAQFDMLSVRLDEITRAISAMPASVSSAADNAPFERLEARLASLAQKIDELEPSSVENEIGSRIEHLASRVAQLADEEAVARLDARIENQILALMPQITGLDHPFMGCCYGLGILAHHLGADVSKAQFGEPVDLFFGLRVGLMVHNFGFGTLFKRRSWAGLRL